MTAETIQRLSALHNRLTRYEVAAVNGEQRILIGYTVQHSRHGLLKTCRAHGQQILDAFGFTDQDMFIPAKKAADGFAIARGEKFIDPVALRGGDEFYRVFEPEAVSAVIEGRRRKNYDYTFAGPTIAQRKAALAEYQYWRELEALSGQREKWKPGLTDETFYADDEVSTHAA